MSTKQVATWNPNACGLSLILSQGNTVVTTGANGLSTARKVLATLPKALGSTLTEHQFYSVPGPTVSLGGNVAIGIARKDSALNVAMGVDALSWGYYPALGVIKNNSATVATIDVIQERLVIQVGFVFYSGVPHMVIGVENTFESILALPGSGAEYVLGATLGGGNAGETSLYSVMGARQLKYQLLATNQ